MALYCVVQMVYLQYLFITVEKVLLLLFGFHFFDRNSEPLFRDDSIKLICCLMQNVLHSCSAVLHIVCVDDHHESRILFFSIWYAVIRQVCSEKVHASIIRSFQKGWIRIHSSILTKSFFFSNRTGCGMAIVVQLKCLSMFCSNLACSILSE